VLDQKGPAALAFTSTPPAPENLNPHTIVPGLIGGATAVALASPSEKCDERFYEAELQRIKGELLLAESAEQATAEACFCQAIETARRQQSKAWELRATMSLARLWQRQGRPHEARAALAAVFDTYTEGFTTPDLVEAAAVLKALA
jgi:predicted ATPase